VTRLGENLNREIPRSSEAYAESKCTAQLAGSDLVILITGELRVYDSATRVQQHAWPLPDIPSGRDCLFPTCSSTPAPVLEDAAHDLAAYTLDGHVHLLRLADERRHRRRRNACAVHEHRARLRGRHHMQLIR